MNATKKLAAIATGALVTGSLAFGGASAAHALGNQYSVGLFKTLSQCNAKKVQYISSYTKITQSCTYYPKQGGFTGNGWAFHYRTVR